MEGNNQMEVVVDASVVVKWFLIEEFREQAIQLRDDYIKGKIELMSPAIMPFEVLNAIRYSSKGIKKDQLEGVGKSLLHYGIKYLSFNEERLLKTTEIAIEDDITIYDAAYIALAKMMQTNLYTADMQLIKKLDDTNKSFVRHIGSYT
jgi:predicted nucleic acid-binding protein